MAEAFLNGAINLLERIKKEGMEKILKASEIMCEAILAGKWIHIFGTGHSHMMADEVSGRAGGLAPFNPILDLSLSGYSGMIKSGLLEKLEGTGRIIIDCEQVRKGDVMIVVSNSGVNAAPVEVATESKKRGLKVIAITSVAHSKSVHPRSSTAKKLFEIADITLDNLGEPGDALVKLEGVEQRVGPTSTITGAAILNAIVSQTALLLAKKGAKPPIWVSGNIPGSEAGNLSLIQKYRRSEGLP
jgi:uncharacterized phosphosugar-binding protein